MEYFVGILIGIVAVVVFRMTVRRVTVLEYEKALKYTRGRFRGVLGTGSYWYVPFFTTIERLDTRPCFVTIGGQEVLSSDGVTLKVSLAANFEISDPDVAVNRVKNFAESLYLELQLALREIVGAADIDTVLSGRDALSAKLMEMAQPKAAGLGLRIISVNLKDIMFPGKLKDIFAQVVNARQEGLAALEKARGESAALRNLANAAKMLENNPNLMQLRLLQAVGESSGNTIVLGMPSQAVSIGVASEESQTKT